MDVFTEDDLRMLMDRTGLCASLYMPAHRGWKDFVQDPVTFRNLVRELQAALEETGMRGREVDKFLSPLKRFLQDDDLFWRHVGDGLAAFVSEDFFRVYRLPIQFSPLATLTGRFQVRPLLPLVMENGVFYILALSQKTVRLYQATRFGLSEVEVTTMPENIDVILREEDTVKEELHSGIRPGVGEYRTGFGSLTESFDDASHYYLYTRAVDKGLRPVFRGGNTPLVLAGVGFLHSVYHETNTYPYLAEEGISGNPDMMDTSNLHERALKIVGPIFQSRRRKAIARYLDGNGPVSRSVEEIVPAADEGRVDTLFVDESAHAWGTYDPESRTVILHPSEQPGDDDLIDFATAATLRNGGAVFSLPKEEMPEDHPAAAILRY